MTEQPLFTLTGGESLPHNSKLKYSARWRVESELERMKFMQKYGKPTMNPSMRVSEPESTEPTMMEIVQEAIFDRLYKDLLTSKKYRTFQARVKAGQKYMKKRFNEEYVQLWTAWCTKEHDHSIKENHE